MTLALLAVALTPAGPHADEFEPSQYRRSVWTDEDGLASNGVTALAQTRDGFLWVGTEEGLIRFDGVRFALFTRQTTPALAHSSVEAMTVTPDGTLLISTSTGLTAYHDGAFRTVHDPAPIHRPVKFAVAPDGTTWVVSLAGLARYAGDRIEYVDSLGGLAGSQIRSLAVDGRGVIWLAGDDRVVRLRADGRDAIDAAALLDRTHATAMLASRDGSLWMGTTRALYRYADGAWTARLSLKTGDIGIEALAEASDGTLWAATSAGLFHWRNGTFESFDVNGEDHRQAPALLLDREGHIWVGRYGGGLERFSKGVAAPFGVPEGLTAGVRPVTQARDGALWLGLTEGGVRRFANGRFTAPSGLAGLPDGVIRSLEEAPDGTLWIATDTGGVHSFRNGLLTSFTTTRGLSHNHTRGLTHARDGSLWVATLGGLDRIRNGVVHHVDIATSDRSGMYSVHEMRDGAIWAGTRSGSLFRIVDGQLAPLPAPYPSGGTTILTLADDADGNVWVGTYGAGFGRFRDGRYRAYTTRDGLFNDVAFQILDDGLGRLWITCNTGIYIVNKADLDAFDAGRLTRIPNRVIGAADGMRTRETNGGDPAGIRDNQGQLWVPTIKGVVRIDPRSVSNLPDTLHVVVEQMRSGASRDGELEFTFTSPTFIAPEQLRFRYRLDAFDEDWREPGDRRSATYTNIPPGQYQFRVQAARAEGEWSSHETTLSVQLLPRFYQTVWFQVAGALLVIGAVAGAMILAARLSERRRAQSEIHRRDQKFRALVEHSADGIMLMDAEMRITYASPAVDRLLGYPSHECEGRLVTDFIHPDDQALVRGYWSDAITRPGMETQGEARFRHADGSWRYIEGVGVNRFDDPAVASLVLNYRDITLRKRHEVELREAMAAAESASEAKSEFLANMSHEIRTPMNGILGLTHLALEAESSQDQRSYLQLVQASGNALLTLINDILDLSKIEAGMLELEHTAFELKPLLAEIVDTMTWRAKEKGLTLSAAIPSEAALRIEGDPSRLRQVIVNLLGNALKFTERGGVMLRVTARETKDAAVSLQFSVTDTGIGIPADKRQLIFEKFTQADGSTTRKFGGTGLGLSICRHIVGMMQGRIWVESTPGLGSTFHFTATFARAAQNIEPRPQTVAAPVQIGTLRILLAEDNPVNQLVAVRVLEKAGHQVTTVADGKQALDALNQSQFDVVLMDVQMPVLNGFEATAKIRAGEVGTDRHQFIVAMTAHALKGDAERCLEAGMDAYVSKPIDRKALNAVLAEGSARNAVALLRTA